MIAITTKDTEIINMVVKALASFENESYVALRGDDRDIAVGQILENSEDMASEENEELNGTSAYCISDCWDEDCTPEQVKSFLEDYRYSTLSIVTGGNYSDGNDQHEIVIENCKVLATVTK